MRHLPAACAMLCVAVGLWPAAKCRAVELPFEVTVRAGDRDRAQAVVRISLDLPAELAQARHVALRGPGGEPLAGQLTAPALLSSPAEPPAERVARELYFVLPRLDAGSTLVLTGTLGGESASTDKFRWRDTPGERNELFRGSRPVLAYMYRPLDESSPQAREETYKVYHHLYDPAGQRLLTKGPGGLYPHHRGLFYGFNRISYDGKSADVWHCSAGAHQSHQAFLASEEGPVLGRQRLAIHWHGADKQVFAHEVREITAYQAEGGQLVEFASRLQTAGGEVRLDGDPQHAGFQFRAAQEVAESTAAQTYYLRPDGPGKPGETRNWPDRPDHVNLPFNAMSFVVGGRRYTAVYLDRPANPKEARYSERDYGRFGSYFEYLLTADKPLEVNYRLWVQEGELDLAQAQALAAAFAETLAVDLRFK